MTLNEIKNTLNAVVISKRGELKERRYEERRYEEREDMNLNIARAYCADLMSDVLAFSITNSLLITHLTNTQVIRTAEIADVKAIVFVQSKRPDIETIALADTKNIPLFVTDLSMYETCGKLYEKGLRS